MALHPKAQAIAIEAHEGQTDKGGAPYIFWLYSGAAPTVREAIEAVLFA